MSTGSWVNTEKTPVFYRLLAFSLASRLAVLLGYVLVHGSRCPRVSLLPTVPSTFFSISISSQCCTRELSTSLPHGSWVRAHAQYDGPNMAESQPDSTAYCFVLDMGACFLPIARLHLQPCCRGWPFQVLLRIKMYMYFCSRSYHVPLLSFFAHVRISFVPFRLLCRSLRSILITFGSPLFALKRAFLFRSSRVHTSCDHC